MSLPLKDFRGGIDESSDMWLDIEAQAHGLDKQAVVRQVLREWAKRKAHAYKIATKRLRANGLQPELFGDEPEDAGVRPEDAGVSRSATDLRGGGRR